MTTIAIIPARGGSKGIPGKNIMNFCGHPLLAWSIAAVRGAEGIDRVYVSTDSDDIAAVALRYGADVVRRPEEISGDRASSEAALTHVCREVEKEGVHPDRVVFLQATSPLRESHELTEALIKFDAEKLDSLFAASVPEDFLMWRETADGLQSLNYDYRSRKRRQDSEGEGRVLIETGSFYITKTDLLIATQNRVGGKIGIYEVPLWKSWEIDSMEGFRLCESTMRLHGLDQKQPMIKECR
jgi:N-acylneuraminate cytidylyltransferase